MYFAETAVNEWVLNDAFIIYYTENNRDITTTNDKIKKDLEAVGNQPNYSAKAKSKANQLLKKWNKTKSQLLGFQSEYDQQLNSNENKETDPSPTPSTSSVSPSITNVITNKDNATFNQTIALHTETSVQNNQPKTVTPTDKQQEATTDKAKGKKEKKKINQMKLTAVRVEEDTHGLLALSNILLVKRGQNNRIFDDLFPHTTLKLIEQKVKEKFLVVSFDTITHQKNVRHFNMNRETKNKLEDVILDVLRDNLTTTQAAKKITNLTSDESTLTPDDMLLLGARNLAECIPKEKTNEAIRESNLSCSYVHSILNPLFTCPDQHKHLIWSNNQVVTGNSMQPDLVVNRLLGSYFVGPSVVGDIKGEDRKDDAYDCLVDLIRIGLLSGGSINKNKRDGVVGVHVVGLHMTFYVTTLMASGIYVMLEICSITLPRDFTEMRSYVANMEDLLQVNYYHEQSRRCSDVEWLELNKMDMLTDSVFFDIINCSKSKKRLCNIVFNH